VDHFVLPEHAAAAVTMPGSGQVQGRWVPVVVVVMVMVVVAGTGTGMGVHWTRVRSGPCRKDSPFLPNQQKRVLP